VALKFRLHRTVGERLPENLTMYLRGLQAKYYARRYKR
jgi:hypothetical protein